MKTNESWLLRLRFPESGEEFTSENTMISIGRSPDNDLPFTHSSYIGGRHAEMYLRDGRWYISDCGSWGGTYVNGVQVRAGGEVLLSPGDLIVLAQAQQMIFVEGRACIPKESSADSSPKREGLFARLSSLFNRRP